MISFFFLRFFFSNYFSNLFHCCTCWIQKYCVICGYVSNNPPPPPTPSTPSGDSASKSSVIKQKQNKEIKEDEDIKQQESNRSDNSNSNNNNINKVDQDDNEIDINDEEEENDRNAILNYTNQRIQEILHPNIEKNSHRLTNNNKRVIETSRDDCDSTLLEILDVVCCLLFFIYPFNSLCYN